MTTKLEIEARRIAFHHGIKAGQRVYIRYEQNPKLEGRVIGVVELPCLGNDQSLNEHQRRFYHKTYFTMEILMSDGSTRYEHPVHLGVLKGIPKLVAA